MSSTKLVPETRLMTEDQLSADDAWHTLRRHGGWCLLRDAFIRFRYGDGFSHSRALALQLCLAVVPFLIALTGLITDLGVDEGGKVVADTVLAITPGQSEAMVQDLLTDSERTEDAGELALTLGLLTGLVALTTTMAQIERGANRIYGVERDRPALAKYLRAAVLAVVAGVPALAGFLILVGGRAMGEPGQRVAALGAALGPDDPGPAQVGQHRLEELARHVLLRRDGLGGQQGGVRGGQAQGCPDRVVAARGDLHSAIMPGRPARGSRRAAGVAPDGRPAGARARPGTSPGSPRPPG